MTAITWKFGQSGLWTSPAAWSTDTVPASGDDVGLAVAPTFGLPYAITLQGSAGVRSVTQTQPQCTLAVASGTLSVAGTYALSAGTLELSGASLQAATLLAAGGTLALGSGGGTLAATRIDGALQVVGATRETYAALSLAGDSFAGAGGSGPGTLGLGPSVLAFLGANPTFDNAAVTLAGATLQQDSGTLSLGSHVRIAATGSSQLGQQFGDAVWTAAQISAIGTGTVLSVEGGTVTNSGTLSVGDGGRAIILARTIDNAGLLSVGAGSYLLLAATTPGGLAGAGGIAVAGGTLSLGTALTTAQLAAFPIASGTLAIAGTLDNAGAVLRSGAGDAIANIQLQSGTISGGTIVNTGAFSIGSQQSGSPGNFASALVGVTVQGALDVVADGAVLDVAGGLVVDPLSGGGVGTIAVTGPDATLAFQGSQTLDHVAIALGSAGGGAYVRDSLTAATPDGTAGVLTLGPDTTVTVRSYYGEIEGQGLSVIANQGTIAAASGNLLTLENVGNAGLIAISGGSSASLGGNLVNTGLVTDTGGQIDESGTLLNVGTVSLTGASARYADLTGVASTGLINTGVFRVAGGATAALGSYGAGWTNTGTLQIAGGEITVGGAFTLAQLGHVQESAGGTLGLNGTLQNTGTLALGAAGAIPTLALESGGAIAGGVILEAGGSLVLQGGLLEQTRVDGVLSLAAPGEQAYFGDGLVLTGAAGSGTGSVALTGAGSALSTFGATLDGATVTIGAAGAGATLESYYNATLTLGQHLVIQQVGGLAQIGGLQTTTVNQGRILAGAAGGTLALMGSFTNAGTVAVSNGETLVLDTTGLANTGAFTVTDGVVEALSATAAQIAALRLTDSQVAVTGTLTAAGATLSAGAGGTITTLKLAGDLVGGTVHDGGGAVQFVGASTLDGVAYQGTLAIGRPFARVTVTDGLHVTNLAGTQPGTITLSGPGSALVWDSTQALDGAVLDIGGAGGSYGAPALLAAQVYQPPAVQLGAHLHVQQTGAYAAIGGAFGTFTSAGVIGATFAHGQLALGGDSFTNTGTIGVSNAETVSATAGGFTNAGLIVVGQGSAFDLNLLDYFASGSLQDQSFSNTGTVQMAGGVLAELTDNGAFPNVPLRNAASGHIVGAGVVASQIDNAGTIEARGGVLNLVQKVVGTGSLRVDAGAMLVTGGVGAGQTASFAGIGGVLGLTPPYFLGSIGGFASGDTIDLFNTAARSAAFSGNTLLVALANGTTLRLATASALSGTLDVTAGTHGDSLVRFAAATPERVAPAWSTGPHQDPVVAEGVHFARAI